MTTTAAIVPQKMGASYCIAILIALGSTGAGSAQCCAGAQDVSVTSKNGVFRVDAVSLTGTGPQHHGPYRYQFRWSDKVNGDFKPSATFEVGYATTDHFGMALYVSPAGNGFLVVTSISPEIVFYHRTGQVLRLYKRSELMLGWYGPADDTGHFLTLWDPTPVPGLDSRRGITSLNYSRRGEIFLPAAQPVAADLELRLIECLTPPQDDSKAVAKLIAGLGSEDNASSELVMQELRKKGGAAVDALEQAAKDASATVRTRAEKVLGEILVQQWGCARPWRDTYFLSALLLYPSASVATAATKRLQAVLATEILEELPSYDLCHMAEWLQTHADQLDWNATAGIYHWKDGWSASHDRREPTEADIERRTNETHQKQKAGEQPADGKTQEAPHPPQ